jgi:hypothetical protein
VKPRVTISPHVKFSCDITKKIGGLEYCAGNGSMKGFDALGRRPQQFFPAIDVGFGARVGVRLRSGRRGDAFDPPSHSCNAYWAQVQPGAGKSGEKEAGTMAAICRWWWQNTPSATNHRRPATGFEIYTAGNGGGVNGGGLPGATTGDCAGREYKATLKG